MTKIQSRLKRKILVGGMITSLGLMGVAQASTPSWLQNAGTNTPVVLIQQAGGGGVMQYLLPGTACDADTNMQVRWNTDGTKQVCFAGNMWCDADSGCTFDGSGDFVFSGGNLHVTSAGPDDLNTYVEESVIGVYASPGASWTSTEITGISFTKSPAFTNFFVSQDNCTGETVTASSPCNITLRAEVDRDTAQASGTIMGDGIVGTITINGEISGTGFTITSDHDRVLTASGWCVPPTTTAIGTVSDVFCGSVGLTMFYAGDVGGRSVLYSMSDDNGGATIQWKVENSATPGAPQSFTDGRSNTATIVADTTRSHPAGDMCAAKGDGQWYLPARDELNLIWVNQAAIGLAAKNFNTSGTYYWSSTEYSSTTSGAWRQRFSDGHQNYHNKYYSNRVRCARSY